MNWWYFCIDSAYRDKQATTKWLARSCAILPANVWTASRLFGAAAVIWLYDQSVFWALAAFMFFAATDFIDGIVARFTNKAGGNGAFLDPAVDKIFILPLLWWFGLYKYHLLDGRLFWLMVILEIAGRFLIAAVWKMRGEKITSQNSKANGWGKLKFTMQIFLIFFLFIALFNLASWWFFVLNIILFIILIFAAISVVSYLWTMPEPQALIKKFRVRH